MTDWHTATTVKSISPNNNPPTNPGNPEGKAVRDECVRDECEADRRQ